MARRPRIHFPGALYHVITRGNRRQGIFLDEKDVKKFLIYLGDYKRRHPFRLYAYALMKNHLHLLVEVQEMPLSRPMQSLLFRYTRYFNRRCGEVGHLFEFGISRPKIARQLRICTSTIAKAIQNMKGAESKC